MFFLPLPKVLFLSPLLKNMIMIKKSFLILLLHVVFLQPLISQVEYTVTIRGNQQNGYPSSLLADNEFVFLNYNMRRGYDYTEDYSGIAKIDAKGIIMDSLVFLPQSDMITYVWNIQKTAQTGIYSGCGVKRYQEEQMYVWMFEFDDQMQILWEEIIDTLNNSAVMRMEHHAIGENRYLFCYLDSPSITCFYNFNKITGAVIKNDSYSGGVDYLCPIPPKNNTFLINDTHNSRKTIVLNDAFEMIKDIVVFDDSYSQPPDCEFIDNTEFVIVRRKLTTYDGLPRSLIMNKVDISSENILATKLFGAESFEQGLGMVGVHKAIAVQKDYFFVFGVSSLQFAPTPVNKFDNNLFLYAFNHELDSIWSIQFDFDAYYWPFSIAPTPDGGCVIGATRYDWHTIEDNHFCDAFIMKIKPEDIVSTPHIENPKPFASVFPTPGSNGFLIQTELTHFTLQLYDLQGQLLLTQQNTKEVDTGKLPSGCYIYRIIAENGITANGKWVKK